MNWATLSSGAAVISVSSEVVGCEAHHVLTDELSQIWLSDTGIPQWICISLQNIPDHLNLEIRTVGWHCWHSFSTNPREVRIHVSRDGAKFRIWDTVSAAVHHQGTQLFCCAPISVALYPFIAFEILTTYGGPQTYMNRIYLYSDEFSPDSVASVSDYEKSSLNITMGLDGIKTADTSTLDDDDSRMDDFRPNRSRINSARPLTHNHPSNVSADFLDPGQSLYPHSHGAPSTINKISPAFVNPQLRDDYAAVLQSYDAYSHSSKSLAEDTTALVDRLSKAIGNEEAQGSFPKIVNSNPPTNMNSNYISTNDISNMPRDGGISPRSSFDHRLFRSPPVSNIIPNPRMWHSDTAALQQQRQQQPQSIPSNVAHSQNTSAHLQSSHMSLSQQPEMSQQRVESLLSSHEGQLFYSACKQLPMSTNTNPTPATSTSSIASNLQVPQKEMDSVLLSTASLQSMRPSVILPPQSSVPGATGQASINTSVDRLSTDDIDVRLKSLEDKFQTLVGILETKQQSNSTVAVTKSSVTKENISIKTSERKSRRDDDHDRHHNRSQSKYNHRDDAYGRAEVEGSSRRRRSLSHSAYRRRYTRSRSPSRSSSPLVDYNREHSGRHSRSRSQQKYTGVYNNRSRSNSRSHSKSRGEYSHIIHDARSNRKSNSLSTYRYSPHYQNLNCSNSVSSEDDAIAAVSPSHDHFEMQSLSSVHSEGKPQAQDVSPIKVPRSEDIYNDGNSPNSGSGANRSSTCRNSYASNNSDNYCSDRHTTTTSTSSILHRVFAKGDGEGIDQLVSRILSEAEEHGRLSDHAASLLRRQTLPFQTLSNNNSNYFDDLLPSAKLALSKLHISSAASDKSRLLTPAAQSILDERVIENEAAQVAVQRVLEKRYPFPVQQDTQSQLLTSKISSVPATASHIADHGVKQSQLSSSPKNSNGQFTSSSDAEGGDELALRIDRLVKDLHHCVLQRTVKEAQLKLLRGESPASTCFN